MKPNRRTIAASRRGDRAALSHYLNDAALRYARKRYRPGVSTGGRFSVARYRMIRDYSRWLRDHDIYPFSPYCNWATRLAAHKRSF